MLTKDGGRVRIKIWMGGLEKERGREGKIEVMARE